jgi:predicted lipoprotein with Yx(FWY)xxD motif
MRDTLAGFGDRWFGPSWGRRLRVVVSSLCLILALAHGPTVAALAATPSVATDAVWTSGDDAESNQASTDNATGLNCSVHCTCAWPPVKAGDQGIAPAARRVVRIVAHRATKAVAPGLPFKPPRMAVAA